MTMREPDQTGACRVWKIDLDHGSKQTPDHEAGIAVWIINGPFHPLWSWWHVAVISLADIPGVPPANKHYPDAEYEFMIASIDPDQKVDIDAVEAGEQSLRFLRPIDATVQFHGVTPEQAGQVGAAAIRAILSGDASPDQDFRSYWERTIPATAKHFAEGAHPNG